jgi:L-seryl-tRNA(Ser) seleniumtransferase
VIKWTSNFGRPIIVEAIRTALDESRSSYAEFKHIPDNEAIINRVHDLLIKWTEPSLTPVINATGVILHTNLGRAPLSQSSLKAMNAVSQGYSNLEYDLKKGKRGSRLLHAEELLIRLTGAEAALVVNNNAAGVMMVLTALARRRSVIIARSQLVEIGGGFRIPDVMKQSGAKLIEVGTTNRVHISDYESVIAERPVAMIMRAHRSNFRIIGFTSEPTLAEISSVAKAAGIPLVDDLGSGSLIDTALYGLGHEPTIVESLKSGADLVCFSGDKLLGGPQAGIIIGRKDLILKIVKHPLARAIRADKLCLAGLSATLLHYVKNEAEREIPIWRMITASQDELGIRADEWVNALGHGEVLSGKSTVGGGSLPGETLPTFLYSLAIKNPNRFLSQLRNPHPPIIARLQEDRVIFDPRTVLPEEDHMLLTALKQTLNNY